MQVRSNSTLSVLYHSTTACLGLLHLSYGALRSLLRPGTGPSASALFASSQVVLTRLGNRHLLGVTRS
eukprot:895657-Rhodomonas_salina.1